MWDRLVEVSTISITVCVTGQHVRPTLKCGYVQKSGKSQAVFVSEDDIGILVFH